MSRFYVPRQAVKDGAISVSGEEAHHILDVMRLAVSDEVVAFDGSGKEYVGIIKEVGRKSLKIQITKTREISAGATMRITLLQSMPKKDKMDYIVEKATELGVHTVVPMTTDRTIVRWDISKQEAAVTRWRKIAREAAKQCGRLDIPTIEPVRTLDEAIGGLANYERVLLAALSEGAVPLKEAIRDFHGPNIAVAIGPEGDFTPEEVSRMSRPNVKLVSLGQRVLKSDTAGLAVMAILNYELSN